MLFWALLVVVKLRYARSTDGRAFMLLLPCKRLTSPPEHIALRQEMTASADFHQLRDTIPSIDIGLPGSSPEYVPSAAVDPQPCAPDR
jgi:hypothetical protein